MALPPLSFASLGEFYGYLDGAVSGTARGFLRRTLSLELPGTGPTRGLPCIDSPTPAVLLVLGYLFVSLLGRRYIRESNLKPRFQEPLALRMFVVFHNAFCLLLSAYMCIGLLSQAYFNGYKIWGNAYNDKETEMAHFLYVFYMSKFVEFMDTIIMLMKRNIRQLTVLHVYHHASIAIIWWIIANDAPGGDAYFSAAMNSGVHVFMYLYYLLSALLRSDEKKRRKYLFWGKYLTQIQMFQFSLNMLHAQYCIKVHAPYPQYLCKILFYYMISLLVLFSNFYVQKYSPLTGKIVANKQSKGD